MITNSPFIGIEVEGPKKEQNVKTLFIPKGSTKGQEEKLKRKIAENNIQRIYLGAGEQRGFTSEDIEFVNSLPANIKLFCEVEVSDVPEIEQLNSRQRHLIEFVLVVEIKDGVDITHLKFMNDKFVYWQHLKVDDYVVTNLKDQRYKEDELI